MNPAKILLFLTILMLGLLAGCGGRTLSQYTLKSPSTAPVASSPYRHATVRVDYPHGIDDTMGTRIYFSKEDLTRAPYRYSRWSQPLNRLLMAHIIEALQRARIFRQVLDYASEAPADYRLETTIYRFDHHLLESGDSVALISLEVRLLSSRDSRILRSRRFDYRIPCGRTDARGFIEAANRALDRFARDLVRWLSR